MGNYEEIHSFNRENSGNYNHRVFSFVRWSEDEKLIIISNFDEDNNYTFDLKLPKSVISAWNLKDGNYQFTDQLNKEISFELLVEKDKATMQLHLKPLASLILRMEDKNL